MLVSYLSTSDTPATGPHYNSLYRQSQAKANKHTVQVGER